MNQWNKLSNFFDVKVTGDEIQGGAMDNILVAWPPIIDLINKHYLDKTGLKALDFGCGVGELCIKLDKLGFKVTGLDLSKGMIDKAKKYVSDNVKVIEGTVSELDENDRFDLITSVQTFQFIEDIEKTTLILDSLLKPGGLLVFATFNPQFVKNCIKENVLLIDFDSSDNPTKGFMSIGDEISIPTYIRTAEEYKEIFDKLGYELLMEEYPPFTEEFLKKYPLKVPPNRTVPSVDSEFLILGFKKLT